MILGIALLSVGRLAVSGQAHAAMPVLSLDRSAVADSPIEEAGYYYRRRWGFRITGPMAGIGLMAITAGMAAHIAGATIA
jgi:hypothetical protein